MPLDKETTDKYGTFHCLQLNEHPHYPLLDSHNILKHLYKRFHYPPQKSRFLPTSAAWIISARCLPMMQAASDCSAANFSIWRAATIPPRSSSLLRIKRCLRVWRGKRSSSARSISVPTSRWIISTSQRRIIPRWDSVQSVSV